MGGGSKQSSESGQFPGTLSPVTASLLSLFGGAPTVSGGQFVPTAFGGAGAAFTPQMFGGLTGLMQNQPLSGVEQFLLGAQPGPPITIPGTPATAGTTAAQAASRGGAGPTGTMFFRPSGQGQVTGATPGTPPTTIPGGMTFGGGIQDMALASALQAQGLLTRGADIIPALLESDPTAAIALARRQFGQETLPAILERAPGFSSSDLQRELGRAGTDLETNIAAMREQGLSSRLQTALTGVPQYAQALGTNLLDQASQVLGFGQLGRDLVRETGPAGDAFRVLTALQSLTGPSITSQGFGTSKGKSTQVL